MTLAKQLPFWMLIWILGGICGCSSLSTGTPSVVLRAAPPITMPGTYNEKQHHGGGIDCNNPAHWNGDTMYLFSSQGQPYRASGPDLEHLDPHSRETTYDNQRRGGRWIEATYKDANGKLYGWYHHEPAGVCPGINHLTAPMIGAVVSTDDGMHWHDLGIVLQAPADSLFCGTANKYFAGGNGDFSVIIDRSNKYFYFLISTYNHDPKEQGISVARMRYADRDDPVGKVWKWHNGQWIEKGLDGHVTPIFGPTVDWHEPKADVFWGPSIHWNSYLKQYVIFLNRSRDKDWNQEGVYVTFNRDIANPAGWTPPVKIIDEKPLQSSKWYPQVIGTNVAARETDKLAGRVARFFVAGKSKWEIVFLRPGEKAEAHAETQSSPR